MRVHDARAAGRGRAASTPRETASPCVDEARPQLRWRESGATDSIRLATPLTMGAREAGAATPVTEYAGGPVPGSSARDQPAARHARPPAPRRRRSSRRSSSSCGCRRWSSRRPRSPTGTTTGSAVRIAVRRCRRRRRWRGGRSATGSCASSASPRRARLAVAAQAQVDHLRRERVGGHAGHVRPAAQAIASKMSEKSPPHLPSTRSGRRRAPQSMPATGVPVVGSRRSRRPPTCRASSSLEVAAVELPAVESPA